MSLYGLIDTARDECLYDLIAASAEHACLFAGWLELDVLRAAPQIVRLTEESRLLQVWANEGRGQSWGIQCTSTGSLIDVRRHFRHFLQAKLPDARTVLFRFYDPRVWRVYFPTCPEDQLRLWFAHVEEYSCESEEGTETVRYTLKHGKLHMAFSGSSGNSKGSGSSLS